MRRETINSLKVGFQVSGIFAAIVVAIFVFGFLISFLTGCNSTAANARDAIAGFHGYLVSAQEKHTMECIQNHGLLPVCDTLRQADAAQNAAVHALEAYCQMPANTGTGSGTTCKPVASLQAGLTAALGRMNAITADIKQAAQ